MDTTVAGTAVTGRSGSSALTAVEKQEKHEMPAAYKGLGYHELNAMLNLPLFKGHGAVRAVAYDEERPGYIDNPELGLSDVNYGRRSGFRVAIAALMVSFSA